MINLATQELVDKVALVVVIWISMWKISLAGLGIFLEVGFLVKTSLVAEVGVVLVAAEENQGLLDQI